MLQLKKSAKWTVAPRASKDQWKCSVCSVVNSKADAECVACGGDNPDPAVAAKAGDTAADGRAGSSAGTSSVGFSFGAPTTGTATTTGAAPASGRFSFGGAATATASRSAVPVVGGVTLSAPPTTTAGTTTGFSFGTTATGTGAATGSTPASGGSRFGFPAAPTTAAPPAPISGSLTFNASPARAGTTAGFSFGAPTDGIATTTTDAAPASGEFSFGGAATPATTASAVPAFGGFIFNAPSTTATAAATGFSFGTSAKVLDTAKVTSPRFASSAPAASTTHPGAKAKLLTAAQYAEELGLDADDAEDIQEDLDSARKAWVQVMGSATKQYEVRARQEDAVDGEGEVDAVLSQLMTVLGATYSGEEYGVALKKVAGTSVLGLEAFTDWYLRWLYKNEDSDGNGDSTSDEEGGGEGKGSPAVSAGGWGNAMWTVGPGASEDQWKCPVSSSVLNSKADAKCVARGADPAVAKAPGYTGCTDNSASPAAHSSGTPAGVPATKPPASPFGAPGPEPTRSAPAFAGFGTAAPADGKAPAFSFQKSLKNIALAEKVPTYYAVCVLVNFRR
jgi:hypothetical protein